MSEQPPFTSEHAGLEEPVIPHRAAPVGPLRHLLSAVVALVAVPLAYAATDYALSHGLNRNLVQFTDGPPPVEALGPFAVALLLFFVASATGRVSGLGPLLAGIVWGAVPAGFALVAPTSLARVVRDLPDLYDAVGFGILTYGVVVFPLVAALLIGAAVSGRWR